MHNSSVSDTPVKTGKKNLAPPGKAATPSSKTSPGSPRLTSREKKEAGSLPKPRAALRPSSVVVLQDKFAALCAAKPAEGAWENSDLKASLSRRQLRCVDALSEEFGHEVFSLHHQQLSRTVLAMSSLFSHPFSDKEVGQVIDGLVAKNTVFSCHDALRVTRAVADILVNHAALDIDSLHKELVACLQRENVLLVEAFVVHRRQDQFFVQLLKLISTFGVASGKSEQTRTDEISQLKTILRSLKQAARTRDADRLDLTTATPEQKYDYATRRVQSGDRKERRKRVSHSMTTDSELKKQWEEERKTRTIEKTRVRKGDKQEQIQDAPTARANREEKRSARREARKSVSPALLASMVQLPAMSPASDVSPYKPASTVGTVTTTQTASPPASPRDLKGSQPRPRRFEREKTLVTPAILEQPSQKKSTASGAKEKAAAKPGRHVRHDRHFSVSQSEAELRKVLSAALWSRHVDKDFGGLKDGQALLKLLRKVQESMQEQSGLPNYAQIVAKARLSQGQQEVLKETLDRLDEDFGAYAHLADPIMDLLLALQKAELF